MGSVIIDSDFPYEIIQRGARDARRHNKRVKDAARKQLGDIISSEDIITSEGNKRVKVRLKNLDSYHFRHYPDRIDNVGRDEFDEMEEGEYIYRPEEGTVGAPKAGDSTGEEVYEVWFTVEELTKMMIEELDLPELDETLKSAIVSDQIEWTDRRKGSGIQSLIDKKQTLLSHIRRKAKLGIKNSPLNNDDLTYRTWEIHQEKHSNAVIFLMMDRSGSMMENKIYAVKALFFWVVQFLKLKYDRVEIKFIAHDVFAKEMAEKDFFSISDDGGTKASSAFELCRDMIEHNYPSSLWNIYCLHSSDGDTDRDGDECADLVREIFTLGAKLFAYVEIAFENHLEVATELWTALEPVAIEYQKMVMTDITDLDGILKAVEKIFGTRAGKR